MCLLCDSGSVSVEVALKQAIQYWDSKEQPEKKKFLSIKRGYHGDTFGAMFVSDPQNSMHSIYTSYGPDNIFAEAPQVGFGDEWDETDIEDFKQKIKKHHKIIAAVILEPVLQGAGGMRTYHPQYLKRVRELCDKYNVLLVLDEDSHWLWKNRQTFAQEHAGICPDIMCVGKAITGGYLTLAAVISTRNVAKCHQWWTNRLFHARSTFM